MGGVGKSSEAVEVDEIYGVDEFVLFLEVGKFGQVGEAVKFGAVFDLGETGKVFEVGELVRLVR